MTTPVKSAQQFGSAKQIKSEGKLSQVGAIKLQTGLPLFRPMWASSVQCRHWSRHMAKASFIPHARVTNTHKSKCSHLPRQSARKHRNGTYSRYGFMVGEFPSPGLTAGRTDRPSVSPCIVSGRVGEEERLSSGEKARIKAFLTWWKH